MSKFLDRRAKGDADLASRVLTTISEWSLYLVVLLLPFFFLPNLVNSLYLGKQFLATILILLSAICILLKVLLKGEMIDYLKTKLTWLLIAFVVGVGLSTVLSGAKYLSFWGFGGSEPFTGLSVILVVLVFFISTTLLADKRVLERVLFLFSLSGAILFVGTFLINVLTNVFKISYLVTLFGASAWNPYGSANALAIFAAAFFVYAFASLFSGQKLDKKFTVVMWVLTVFGALNMLIVGYRYAYLLIVISLLLFLAFIFIKYKQEFMKKINVPLLVFIVFFLLFAINPQQTPWQQRFNFPVEVSPTSGLSFSVAWNSMREGIVNFLVGSGPSTFPYDFAMYKPDSINLTNFWNVRFTAGYAAVPTLMAELGLFGLLFFSIFVVYNLLSLIKRVVQGEVADGFYNGLTLAFIVLVGSLFVYPLNFTAFLYLFLILVLALAIAGHLKGSIATLSFDKISHKTLLIALGLIGTLIGTAFLFFISTTYFIAEVKYTRGLVEMSKGNNELAVAKFLDAVKWYRDDSYYRTLSSALVTDTLTKMNKAGLSAEQVQALKQNLQTAMAFAKKATEINSIEKENWYNLGGIYEQLSLYVVGADEAALQAYQQVEKLEPNNPVSYLAEGRVYLSSATLLQQQINQAKSQAGAQVNEQAVKDAESKIADYKAKAGVALNKALQKKNNLEAPYVLLAKLDEMNANLDSAISNLRSARLINPQNIDTLFDLGRLLYNKGAYDQAALAMNNILAVYPESGNVHYLLGLAYDGLGDKAKAIEQFKWLKDKDQQNPELGQILSNLQSGKPAISRAEQKPAIPTPPAEQLNISDIQGEPKP